MLEEYLERETVFGDPGQNIIFAKKKRSPGQP
jgi:hypothetical protein